MIILASREQRIVTANVRNLITKRREGGRGRYFHDIEDMLEIPISMGSVDQKPDVGA